MNRNALTVLITLTVLVIAGYYYYQYSFMERFPGDNKSRLANQHLEDGKLETALRLFNEALAINPEHKDFHVGKAITLMQMQRHEESLEAFDTAIEIDPDFAMAYANRAILNDRSGNFKQAIVDYRKAVELNPKLDRGPGYLWRFLHNVAERPPTLSQRADYLEEQLKKPKSERVLRVPELDSQQKMYKK